MTNLINCASFCYPGLLIFKDKFDRQYLLSCNKSAKPLIPKYGVDPLFLFMIRRLNTCQKCNTPLDNYFYMLVNININDLVLKSCKHYEQINFWFIYDLKDPIKYLCDSLPNS